MRTLAVALAVSISWAGAGRAGASRTGAHLTRDAADVTDPASRGAATPSASTQAAATPVNTTLTAVPGIKVGHHTLTERPTGCTVILTEAGVTAGVDIR